MQEARVASTSWQAFFFHVSLFLAISALDEALLLFVGGAQAPDIRRVGQCSPFTG
jgi:hypothetical protein